MEIRDWRLKNLQSLISNLSSSFFPHPLIKKLLQRTAGRFCHHRFKISLAGGAAAEALHVEAQAGKKSLVAHFQAQGVNHSRPPDVAVEAKEGIGRQII